MKRKKKKPVLRLLPCGVYRHYKGNFYLVLGLACHSETEELHVVYTRLYARAGYPFWIRPLENFTGSATTAKGKKVKRFTFVGVQEPAPKK